MVKITKIVCDKCGKEIEGKCPDRLQLMRHFETVGTSREGLRYGPGYKKLCDYYLCEDCMKECGFAAPDCDDA